MAIQLNNTGVVSPDLNLRRYPFSPDNPSHAHAATRSFLFVPAYGRAKSKLARWNEGLGC